MKGFKHVIILSSLAIISACTEPGEMTGVSAATGGVVGAGLGAIVGNQTGNPGAGLVIGAVAGAGAGAAVGNVLEAQDQAIKQQDEAIERQEQVIRAQRGEIEELRRGTQDSARVRTTYSAGGPRARYGGPIDKSLVLKNVPSRPATPVMSHAIERKSSVTQVAANVAKKPAPAVAKRGLPAPTGPTLVDAAQEEVSGDSAITDMDASDGDRAMLSVDKKIEEPTVLEVKKSAPEPVVARSAPPSAQQSSDCLSAEEEFSQAAAKTETPDKLFHIRRALRLCPTEARYHSSLGDVYASLNRANDARFEYQEALKLAPNDSVIKEKVGALPATSSDPY